MLSLNDGPDADADGLCDAFETDDDNDGWSDADEVACGTDPLSNLDVPTGHGRRPELRRRGHGRRQRRRAGRHGY